jgi:transcription elongation factor/antiterminator RfaH
METATLPAGETARHWYAIYTRSRHEKLVAEQLAQKNITIFLPLQIEVHRWQDRYKKVEMPLFRGYVFAQFDHESAVRTSILRTSGVVRIVGFGQEDAPVPGEQVASLQRLLETRQMVHRHRYLQVGERVKVINGAMAGLEGILVRVKKQDRLVISIELIRQAVAVELSGYEVVPLSRSATIKVRGFAPAS